jgi:hypothetical protein
VLFSRKFCTPSEPYKPSDLVDVDIVRKKGVDLIHDPIYNKVYPSCPPTNEVAIP